MDAIDNLGDAIDTSREFLVSCSTRNWIKLAIVMLFISTTVWISGPPIPPGDPSGLEIAQTEFETDEFSFSLTDSSVIQALIGVLIIAGILWILIGLVRALLDFVFIEALRNHDIQIRKFGRTHVYRAIRLFGFRIGLTTLFIGTIALVILFAIQANGGITAIPISILVWLSVFAILVYLLHGLLIQFTTEFIVPIMVLEERGVLSAWRQFLPTARTEWSEYLVYIFLTWIIRVFVGIGVTILLSIAALVLALPLLIVFGLGYMLVSGLAGLFIGLFLVTWALTVIMAYGIVMVPVVTYLRYYALLLLGDTNDRFDLIPEQRNSIRKRNGRGLETEWDRAVEAQQPDSNNSTEDSW